MDEFQEDIDSSEYFHIFIGLHMAFFLERSLYNLSDYQMVYTYPKFNSLGIIALPIGPHLLPC